MEEPVVPVAEQTVVKIDEPAVQQQPESVESVKVEEPVKEVQQSEPVVVVQQEASEPVKV